MIELRVKPGLEAATGLLAVKQLAWTHPGEHELLVVVERPPSAYDPKTPREHRLHVGPAWTYSGDAACLAALSEFGEAQLLADER